MFIIGNMDSLIGSGSQTWKKIKKDLEDQENFGNGLELICQTHETTTIVENIKDFDKVPEGGCTKMCDGVLNCGHICTLVCHPKDRNHEQSKCQVPCNRKCIRGHSCYEKCYIDCTSLCTKWIKKLLACGHIIRVKCPLYDQEIQCVENVMKKLACGHEQSAACFLKEESIRCTTKIDIIAKCEHKLQIKCHEKNSKHKCVSKCDTRMKCGHTCGGKCHIEDDPRHKKFQCLKLCARSCKLGHLCRSKHKCHLRCQPCEVLVEKSLICGHKAQMACGKDSKDEICKVIVTKQSSDCDHEITGPCHLPRNKKFCFEKVLSPVKSLCGHQVMIPCQLTTSATCGSVMSYCTEPCSAFWEENTEGYCGHSCTGNCSSCFQGRVHQKCDEKCGRNLPCGHSCKYPCSSLCPPCKEKCEYRCQHSKCKLECGNPCTLCKEPCASSCEHSKCSETCASKCNRMPCDYPCRKKLKCGHQCIGLCGEVCPKLCRSCNHDEVTDIFLGHEDEPNARFIYLVECGHSIEVKGMDYHMNVGANKGDVSPKRCPKCNCIIKMCGRYSNIFKSRMEDMDAVKKLIYGNNVSFGAKLNEIIHKLSSSSNNGQFHDFRQHLMQIVCIRRENVQTPLKPKRMNQYMFESVDNITSWWHLAESNIKEIKANGVHIDLQSGPKIVSQYQKLFGEIKKRKLPLSRREILEFEREFDRLTDEMKVYRREMIEELEEIPEALELLSKAQNLILRNRNKRYTESIKSEILEIIQELDVLIKEKISTWEKESRCKVDKDIFKAVGFGVNHWKKCPQGHFYVIGDCGQPNATSQCPECRSVIGAQSYHVLASGNSNVTLDEINNGPDTSRMRSLLNDK